MSWYRRNPLFATALGVCAVLALGELWCIYERYTAAHDAARKLEQKRTELTGMADVMPPPTREVATAIESDLARAQRTLAAMQKELKGHGPAAERMRTAKVPAARTDAYFDLATFVEKMRTLAGQDGVAVRPEAARFGFSAYANEGPEAERIEPVFHQRQVAQYLLQSLFDARPRALLSVKRERSLTKTEREARDAALVAAASGQGAADASAENFSNAPEGPDFFAIDPQVSVRVPNYVDSTAFRIVFTGQTTALRGFLDKLATFELPILVRAVEVEPASAEDSTATPADDTAANPGAAPADATPPSIVLNADTAADATPKPAAVKVPTRPTATPIVEKPLSKFTVTVEYIDLITPPPAADANAPAAPAPTS